MYISSYVWLNQSVRVFPTLWPASGRRGLLMTLAMLDQSSGLRARDEASGHGHALPPICRELPSAALFAGLTTGRLRGRGDQQTLTRAHAYIAWHSIIHIGNTLTVADAWGLPLANALFVPCQST